jgi:hypothetical protein
MIVSNGRLFFIFKQKGKNNSSTAYNQPHGEESVTDILHPVAYGTVHIKHNGEGYRNKKQTQQQKQKVPDNPYFVAEF